MSLWKIAWRSIEQRSLASSLTALSMALGVALVVAVLVVHGLVSKSFMTGSGLGYNMIVGADKGGKLQLVLNTVYYLSSPVENIPYSFYKEFTDGKYKAYVSKAIPVCLGDYYDQFRVIGTTPAFFGELTYNNGQRFTFSEGANFKQDEFFTGVIGATVARELGLKVGSEFRPTHGVEADHSHDPFRVVGVLSPTGTPNDRALFINMEGFYLTGDHAKPVKDSHAESTKPAATEAEHHAEHDDHHEHADKHTDDESHAEHAEKQEDHHEEHAEEHDEHAQDGHGDEEHDHPEQDHEKHGHDGHTHDHGNHNHAHHHHDPIPDEARDVTALLVLTSGNSPPERDLIAQDLIQTINEGQDGQAVQPIREIRFMFQLFVDPVRWLLLGLTVLIVIVAGISILVSIYNSMSERTHDIAVMRALGAGRQTVMLVVLFESILLALGGGLCGWLLGHVTIWALNPWLATYTGLKIGLFQGVGILLFNYFPLELVIIVGLIVLAAIVGSLPALAAYRTDVAKALSASP